MDSANYSVQWDTPVSSLLREDFVLTDDWATEHITIIDALSHQTGYPRHDLSRGGETGAELARTLRHLPMTAEPRTTFLYNNIMFEVMGYLVEVITGRSLTSFFRNELWSPWGMHSTFHGLGDLDRSGRRDELATSYWYNNDTDGYLAMPYMVFPDFDGAGSVISNVKDYSLYLRAMMDEAAPISKSGYRAIKGPHMIEKATQAPWTGPVLYGLAWFSSVFAGEQVWFHTGQVDQFEANMIMIPSRKFAVVMLQNSASLIREVIPTRILYDYFDVPEERRVDIEER